MNKFKLFLLTLIVVISNQKLISQVPDLVTIDFNYYSSFNKKQLLSSGSHHGLGGYDFYYSNERVSFGSDFSVKFSWLFNDISGIGISFGRTDFTHLTDVRITSWSDDLTYTDNFASDVEQEFGSFFVGMNYFIEKKFRLFNFSSSFGFQLYDFGYNSYIGYLNRFREKYIANSIKLGISKSVIQNLNFGIQLICNNYILPLQVWDSENQYNSRYTEDEYKPFQIGIGFFLTYHIPRK